MTKSLGNIPLSTLTDIRVHIFIERGGVTKSARALTQVQCRLHGPHILREEQLRKQREPARY